MVRYVLFCFVLSLGKSESQWPGYVFSGDAKLPTEHFVSPCIEKHGLFFLKKPTSSSSQYLIHGGIAFLLLSAVCVNASVWTVAPYCQYTKHKTGTAFLRKQ